MLNIAIGPHGEVIQARFVRGWRTAPRPDGLGNFGICCYVPIDRIILLECIESAGGWVATMDFNDADGDPVVIKGIETPDIAMIVGGSERPAADEPTHAVYAGHGLTHNPPPAPSYVAGDKPRRQRPVS